MKRLVVVVVLAIASISFWLSAASLDGTSSTKYMSTVQIFRRGMDDYVRGFARLGNGFAVASRASAFMDTNISVSGQMDLGETGTLVLLNNLYFDRSITLTSGGNIKGKATVSGDAKTIFLGGDMTLSATTNSRVLHITGDWSNSGTSGDLIIDGRGHTLDIQDRAQIFVDTNVTLTLRNMTIRTGAKSFTTPPIRLASSGSKLALDNVMFDLGVDFQFKQGQLFIHDEVAMTGTSAFIYQSPVPSYITSGATWAFEAGTTFSVAPRTSSDTFYNGVAPYMTSNFIVPADASSALYLNGCTLKTTYTGLRLTTGMVMFDNRVAVDTMAGVDLNATTPITQIASDTVTSNYYVRWSPDGRYIYTGGSPPKLYAFNGTSLTYLRIMPTGGVPAWTPDGRFWVILTATGLDVYKFNGSSQPTLYSYTLWSIANPKTVCFSPDGRFAAVLFAVTTTSITIQIWKFNGQNPPTFVGSTTDTTDTYDAPNTRFDIGWSPDGRFLAVPNNATTGTVCRLYIYRIRAGAGPQQVSSALLPTSDGTQPVAAQWSPDGRTVALINMAGTTRYLYAYRFDGNKTLTAVGSPVVVSTVSNPYTVQWSPDGRYVTVAPEYEYFIKFFKFDASSGFSLMTSVSTTAICWTDWSQDMRYMASTSFASNAVYVYRLNFVSTPATQQSFTNGLVFGRSAKGSGYNANVKVFAGAGVTLQGKVMDDSA